MAEQLKDLIKQTNTKSISDFGTGMKNLLLGLKDAGINHIEYYSYDPVFPEYGPPRSAELVCCIDVLERIEPEKLDSIIKELAEITPNLGFFSIHMGPAGQVLADGRNAHLIKKPSSWWLPLMTAYFDILHLQSHQMMGNGFWFIVKPKEVLL